MAKTAQARTKPKLRRTTVKAKSKPESKTAAPAAPSDAKLSDRQQRFVDEYLTCWNAAEAARRAGYSKESARFIGSENLTKPNIRAEIDRHLKVLHLTADEVLAMLAAHARNEIGAYVIIGADKKPAIDVAAMIRDGKQYLIKGISYTRSGQVVVETYDAQAALVHVGRYHKLFAERVEHAGTDGGPIQVEDINATRDRRWEGLAPVVAAAIAQGDPDADAEGSPPGLQGQ